MAKGMIISRAAERAGVGVETIRFYERFGLIEQPARPASGGYRLYDDEIIDRIRFIRQAQGLGFSLREIAELLSLRSDPSADCGDILTQAAIKREEVSRKIMQLERIRTALDGLIASCPGDGALCGCTILDAMAGQQKATGLELPSKTDSQNRTPEGGCVKTATFRIDGMYCNDCARTVEALVSTEPGVGSAEVSFKTGEVRILFDPRARSEEQLATAIRRAGYSVAIHAS